MADHVRRCQSGDCAAAIMNRTRGADDSSKPIVVNNKDRAVAPSYRLLVRL